jgi:hypothetical protein
MGQTGAGGIYLPGHKYAGGKAVRGGAGYFQFARSRGYGLLIQRIGSKQFSGDRAYIRALIPYFNF